MPEGKKEVEVAGVAREIPLYYEEDGQSVTGSMSNEVSNILVKLQRNCLNITQALIKKQTAKEQDLINLQKKEKDLISQQKNLLKKLPH